MPLLVDYLDVSRSHIGLCSHQWLILVNGIGLTHSLLMLLSRGSHLLLLVLGRVEDIVLRRLNRVAGRIHVWVSLTHVHWALSTLRRIHRIHGLLLPHRCLTEGDFAKDLELFLCVSSDWSYCLASI